MVWPAVIGAVAGIAGGLMSNSAKKREAQRNRDFQAQQSGSAHQREVLDLKAAGLNPILSGTGGMGATTSAGSMADQQDPITPAIHSALEARRNDIEMKNVKMDTTRKYWESENQSAQSSLNTQLIKKAMHDTNSAKSASQIVANEAQTSKLEQTVIQAPGEKERRILERWLKTIGIGGSSAKTLRSK